MNVSAAPPVASRRVLGPGIAGLAGLTLALPLLVLPEIFPPILMPVVAVVAVASLAAGVILLARHAGKSIAIFAAIFAVTAVIGWLRASGAAETLPHFSGIGIGVLMLGVGAAWLRSARRLIAGALLFLLVGSAALLLGLIGSASPPDRKGLPQTGLMSILPRRSLGLPGLEATGHINSNALGALALMVAPVALVLMPARREGQLGLALGVAAAGAALVSVYVLYYSHSRSAWLAAWLTLTASAVRIRHKVARLVTIGLMLAVPAAGLFAFRAADPAKFESMRTEARETVDKRMFVFTQAFEQFRKDPVAGIGLNEFRHVFQPRRSRLDIAHAHNIFLQTVLDVGVVGLVAYVGLLTLLVMGAVRAAGLHGTLAGSVAAGAGLSILAVHLFGLADAVPLGAKIGLMQWLAAALILGALRVQAVEREA